MNAAHLVPVQPRVPLLKGSLLVLLIVFLSIFTPTPRLSHAIPSTGDYIFSGGSFNGVDLFGTFTSTGSQLIRWDIALPFAFALPQHYIGTQPSDASTNNSIFFEDSLPLGQAGNLSISWSDLAFIAQGFVVLPDPNDPSSNGIFGSVLSEFTLSRIAPVPEPSTAYLVLLGLMLLLGYRWRQRRQAGPQIG